MFIQYDNGIPKYVQINKWLRGMIDRGKIKDGEKIPTEVELAAKFDLHWLRKYGIDVSAVKVWDCSLVDFMLEAQTTPYPSMNKMAEKYKLAQKPDIKATYWENNICTKDIPKDEIVDYLMEHDLPTTKAIYEIQQEQVNKRSKAFQRLISLANQDLLVLEEMEYNGLYFDEAKCLVKAEEIKIEITGLQQEISDYHNIEAIAV